MDSGIQSGLFTVLGALLAGISSYLAVKTNTDWKRAKSDIENLTEQLTSYHKLEELYMKRVAELEPSAPAAVTVQKNMRNEVADLGLKRPEMTANEARKIWSHWR